MKNALDRIDRVAGTPEATDELEALSYAISHDLRAPLRHIQAYAEMLAEDTGSVLSDEGRRFLGVIAAAGAEMGALIDGLLAYLRIGRADMRMRELDLDDLLRSVVDGLKRSLGDRTVVWKLAPLPRALGDAAMLRQLFAELLGNALKSTRQRGVAEIEVGAAGVEDGRTVLFVRDNGAGFDMQVAGQLFGIFQRLDRGDEGGAGVGLAIVRRIVDRHGGRVWADAAAGSGATFYLTLAPAAEATAR